MFSEADYIEYCRDAQWREMGVGEFHRDESPPFEPLTFTRRRWTRARKRYNRWRRTINPFSRIAYQCWSRMHPEFHAYEAQQWGRR